MYIMFVIIEVSWFVCATLLYCKVYVTARRHMKQIQMQQVQQMERGNEVEHAAVITKSSVSILCHFGVTSLLYAKLLSFSLASNTWKKYHYRNYATLYRDSDISEFVSEPCNLLLEDETHSKSCHGHIKKMMRS